MSSFLRPLAYRHRWIYDTVTALSSLSVGGVERLRSLGLHSYRAYCDYLESKDGEAELLEPL